MKRDLPALERTIHDILVVGSGIYGACIARDAAQRGLKVALIDRGDFGGATSHNSFKLIHGGLRYLQHLDPWRVRESAREQRNWLTIAPHLVRPLAFVLPIYGRSSREVMRAAIFCYDQLTRGGSKTLLPQSHIISRQECLERVPSIAESGLTGGMVWFDAQMLNADRLLLECVSDAVAHGAIVANYVSAERLLGSEQSVKGAHARDILGGDSFPIRAKITINACGPFASNFLKRAGAVNAGGSLNELAIAMNLVTRRPLFDGYAVGVSSRQRSDSLVPRRGGRVCFFTPWCGRTVVGTNHMPFSGDADVFQFTESAIEAFLAEIANAYPSAELTRDDVLYCYAGLTPISASSRVGTVQRARRGQVVDHARLERVQNLLSVQGVKYTTARLVAESVVDLAVAKLCLQVAPCSSAEALLPGAHGYTSSEDLEREALSVGTDRSAIQRLVYSSGTSWRNVLACEGGRMPLAGADIFGRRVRYAVRHEMAVRLEDVILRRFNDAALGMLDEDDLASAANIVADELSWAAARRSRELQIVREQLRRHRGIPAA